MTLAVRQPQVIFFCISVVLEVSHTHRIIGRWERPHYCGDSAAGRSHRWDGGRAGDRRSLWNVISRVESAEQADGGHPAVHVLLRLGHQVPRPLLRPQVEHKAALKLLLCERQAGINLFTQVQVDGPDWPPGLLVLEVLQDVWLSTQPTASQHKPSSLPRIAA